MLIAITGTPGVGKTTVAEILVERGYRVLNVNELAESFDCIIDEEEGCKIVDVESLAEIVKRSVSGELVFLEGHLSHLLNPDVAIVLRCNPIKLKDRLESKGWEREKILENVEAEIVDVITISFFENVNDFYEIDTSDKTPEEVANDIESIVKGHGEDFRAGKIDWISVVADRIEDLIRG